jgi:pimeloyl-ACP methyl ester carboxylesterase
LRYLANLEGVGMDIFRKMSRLFRLIALVSVAVGLVASLGAAPHFDPILIPGRLLEGNPLGDPVQRRVAVFTPVLPRFTSKLLTVYYLPGYGGSSEDFFGRSGNRFAEAFQNLADKGIPLRMVVVDCRNRWGGSQYLNSPAQGNYADYLLEEVIPQLEKHYGTPATPRDRIIAGHSSGGFGALRVAMMAPERFGAVVALSPDTDFEVTHRPLVEEHIVKSVTPKQLASYVAPPERMIRPGHNLVQIILGLSAAYAPKGPNEPGEFHWLYDEKGNWQAEVWQNWLEEDTVVIARRNPHLFMPYHKIYLDGAEHDEFGAQKGSKVLRDLIKPYTRVEFFESPGGHADFIEDRLARGLEWVFERKLRNVAGR